jgi:hypothetical protein
VDRFVGITGVVARAAGLRVVLALLLIARTTTAMVRPRMAIAAVPSSTRRCWWVG